MLKLPAPLRDQITGYLSTLVVPAAAGADLMKVVAALRGLEPVEPIEKEAAPNRDADEGAAEGR